MIRQRDTGFTTPQSTQPAISSRGPGRAAGHAVLRHVGGQFPLQVSRASRNDSGHPSPPGAPAIMTDAIKGRYRFFAAATAMATLTQLDAIFESDLAKVVEPVDER